MPYDLTDCTVVSEEKTASTVRAEENPWMVGSIAYPKRPNLSNQTTRRHPSEDSNSHHCNHPKPHPQSCFSFHHAERYKKKKKGTE